tara:strand:- start:1278 stop:1592 length:315 start_codon:yes stop_codon:yes gene_type:complete
VNKNMKYIGSLLVFVLSTIAIMFAIAQLVNSADNLAIYNLIRAMVFTIACIYFFRNPSKINFVGPLKIGDSGNATPLNIKISYALSYLFSFVNLAISLALYFDP